MHPRAIRPSEKISLNETDPEAHAAVKRAVWSGLSGVSAGVRLVIDRDFGDKCQRYPDELNTAIKSVKDILTATGVSFVESHPWGNRPKDSVIESCIEFSSLETHMAEARNPEKITEEWVNHAADSNLAHIRDTLALGHPVLVEIIQNVEVSPASFQKGLLRLMDEATAKSQRFIVICGSSIQTASKSHPTGGLISEFEARFPRVNIGPSPFAAQTAAEMERVAAWVAKSRKENAPETAQAPERRGAKPV